MASLSVIIGFKLDTFERKFLREPTQSKKCGYNSINEVPRTLIGYLEHWWDT